MMCSMKGRIMAIKRAFNGNVHLGIPFVQFGSGKSFRCRYRLAVRLFQSLLICAIVILFGMHTAEAAALRFHSDNSIVSSGLWFTVNPPSSIDDAVDNPRPITSYTQGQTEVPYVVFVVQTDDYSYMFGTVKTKIELITDKGTFVLESSKYVSGTRFAFLGSLNAAINLPAGQYTVRVTVSCDGYASATATKTLRCVSSPYSLAQALGCADAVANGWVSLASEDGYPSWIGCMDNNGELFAVSGAVGKNGQSVLTLMANKDVYIEYSAARIANPLTTSTSSDRLEIYDEDRQFITEICQNVNQGYVCDGIQRAGTSRSWVFTRAPSDLELQQLRIGALWNMTVRRMVHVDFDLNGGNADVLGDGYFEMLFGVDCIPGEQYNYLDERLRQQFPENGPTPPDSNHKFAGWYNAAGEKITGSSIVPKSASDHTLKARWEKEKNDAPDLIVSVAYADKTTIYESESARIHWRVSNIGEEAAMETSTFYTYGKRRKSAYCPSLAKGGHSDSARTLYGSILGVGTHTITIMADGDGRVDEENEDNNTASVTITVIPDPPPPQPLPQTGFNWQYHKISPSEPGTLYLSSSEQSQSSANVFKVGQRIYLQVNFWNAAGNQSLEPVRVRFELDDERYGELQWPGNGEHGSRGSSTNGYWIANGHRSPTWLQNLPKGEYTLTAILDSEKRWSEQSESDNVQEISFVVEDMPAPTIFWVITFNANGGNVSETTRRVANGTAIGTLPTPTRSGYTFAGWWTSASGGLQVSASSQVDANVTYYAHWTQKASADAYKVSFNKNGGTGGDNYVTATYGAAMPTPRTAPTLSGWTFGGYWDTLACDEKGNPKGKQYYDASMKSVRNWDKKRAATLSAATISSRARRASRCRSARCRRSPATCLTGTGPRQGLAASSTTTPTGRAHTPGTREEASHSGRSGFPPATK